ncbi:MAG: DUF447 domain-containing protein [Rhodocyclaceae bacterium]
MIFETVVSTLSPEGEVHLAPMGVRYETEQASDATPVPVVLLMPFKPSRTLDNILATRRAVLNFTTDVRIFAGCVTGRRNWPTQPLEGFDGQRLVDAIGHVELHLQGDHDDAVRPVLRMRRGREVVHAGFQGFNRAQAAVIEAAVLVSRLGMLPRTKVESEMDYLQIAIDKTAGPREQEAWDWLFGAVEHFYASQPESER